MCISIISQFLITEMVQVFVTISVKDKNTITLLSHYDVCWCPCEASRQSNGSHCYDSYIGIKVKINDILFVRDALSAFQWK